MLTSTLYVDFGDDFPVAGLAGTIGTLKTATSGVPGDPAVTGPDMAGATNSDWDIGAAGATNDMTNADPFTLVGFNATFAAQGGVYAGGVTQLRADIMSFVRREYEPFDIDVVELTSVPINVNGRLVSSANTLAEISSTLGANEGEVKNNDSYVLLGRMNVARPAPAGGNFDPATTFGGYASVVDMPNNNNTDNSAIGYLSNNAFGFANFVGYYGNLISHEAGHTFGLQHSLTQAPGGTVSPQIPTSEIMSYLGNNDFQFFSRYPQVRGNGNTNNNDDLQAVGAPVANRTPYDQWAFNTASIGANPDFNYVTGTGAHDIITVTSLGAATAQVNVQAFSDAAHTVALAVPGSAGAVFTYSYTVSLDRPLVIDGGDLNDRIVLDGDLGVDVNVRGMSGVDTLVVNLNGASAVYTPSTASGNGLDGNPDLRGSIEIGGSTINFQEFEATSGLTLNAGGGTVEYVTPGVGGDNLTLSNNAAANPQITGSVDDGNAVIPLEIIGAARISIQTGDANDVLTVDSTNGLIFPSTDYDGGDGFDRLNVTQTGGPTRNNSFVIPAANPGDGQSIVEHGAVQFVNFFNIEPVVDNVPAAAFSLNLTPGIASLLDMSNAINYSTGVLLPTGGRITVDNFEPIEFENKTALFMNAANGDDVVNLNNPNTPTGLTAITVGGGDSGLGDTVTLNSRPGLQDQMRLAPADGGGTVTQTGRPTITIVTTENLRVVLEPVASDHFTVDGTTGNDTFRVQSGPNTGEEILTGEFNQLAGAPFLLPTIHITGSSNALIGTMNFNGVGGNDTLIVTGTGTNDTFNFNRATATSGNIDHDVNGLQTNFIGFANFTTIIAEGGDGDDSFNVPGNFPTNLRVNGGNPSGGSDTVTLNGAGAAITVDLQAETVQETGFALVTLSGVEDLVVNGAAGAITVNATTAPDKLKVSPTAANDATIELEGDDLTVFTSNTGALNVNLVGTGNELTVEGTSAAEVVTVTGLLVTVGALKTVNYSNSTSLRVLGAAGADTFNVTTAAGISMFIDGGDPIGTTGDTLNITPAGAFQVQAGPEVDEGGLVNGTARVSWDHIEQVAVTGGGPALILGTNGDDDITVIARDASTHAGTDGVQDFTVTVNDSFSMLFINQASLAIDALAGDDDIVVRAPAPNNADWNVQITVGGGPAASQTTDQGDTLEVETPGGADQVIFTPTGPETGTFTIDQGTDSVITMVNGFIFNPGVDQYIFSPGGIENVVYDGVGSAGFDNLTINGTIIDDVLTYGTDAFGGSFRSIISPDFDFSVTGRVTFNGNGNFDVVNLKGGAGDDIVTSTATAVTVDAPAALIILTIGTGVERLVLDTGAGNDNIDLDLQVTGLQKFIYAGDGNDTVNLLGVIVDPADPTIYGGDGDDTIVGSPNPDLIFGGRGADVLIGAGDNDDIYGEEGNDRFGEPLAGDPAANDPGNDLFDGGEGSDLFVWDPGDGSDVVEGGVGNNDVLVFHGSAGAEAFNLFADTVTPTRMQLFRSIGTIRIDSADIEEVDIVANGGIDTVDVGTSDTGVLSDLSTTALRDVDVILNGDGAADTVTVQGRALDDNMLTSFSAGFIRTAGLKYDVRTIADTTDRLVINGNEGNDNIKVNAGVEAAVLITLNGGDGNDILSADAIINGGNGDDTLTGGAGADTINGNAGNDIIVGGTGIDTIDGGAGEDTIFVDLDGAIDVITGGTEYDTITLLGTTASDVLSAFQSAAGTLATSRNGVVDSDTIATVERVLIEAGAGDDTIFVQHLDGLKNDGPVNNSVLFQVDGGAAWTADRLVVQDNGASDVMIYRKAADPSNGSVTVAPINAGITESLNTVFENIEYVDPRTTNANNIFVFKYDPFEWNGNFQNATHLGAGTLNVDPVIDPGVPAVALPPGFPALPGADEDFYRIEAEVTGTLDIQAFFRQNALLPGGGDIDIELLDADGTSIASDLDIDDDARIRIAAVEGQVYFLHVFAGVPNAINTYSLTVINEAAPTPFALELADSLVILGGDPNRTGTANFTYDPVFNTFNLDLFVAGVELINTNPNVPQLGQVSIQTLGGVVVVNIPTAAAIQEPNGVRLTLQNVPFSGVAADITALQNGALFVDVDYTAPVGSIRGQILSDFVFGNSDTGRSQHDNVITTNNGLPTIFIRVADSELRNDVPDNGNAPGGPVDGDVLPIPFVPSTLINAPAGTTGFRVAVFVSEADTGGGLFVGYAQPVINEPGVYAFTFPGAFGRDGSWFISSRVEMIDPASPEQAQGFGEFSDPFEIVVDTTAPPAVFGLVDNALDGLHPSSDSGIPGFPASFNDGLTSDTTPTFWGTAEANAIIRLFVDSPINGTLGVYDPGLDPQIGMSVALPFDGTNASPNGNWQVTSQIDLNNPFYFPVPDGLRTVFMTAEDLAGNINPDAANAQLIQTLVFALDTLGPQVTDVDVNSAVNPFDLFNPKPVPNGPTPVTTSLVISYQDFIGSAFPFPNGALDPVTATTPGHYILKGDYNGIIPIQSIVLNPANPVPPVPGPAQGVVPNPNVLTATVTLNFFSPLPDDRYTLTILDTILDQAGNALDGDTNALEPQPGTGILGIDGDTDPFAIPSGDLVPGTSFVARFTIDTRPEVGVFATASAWVDLNGNTSFDPTNVDFTNRDVIYQFGTVNDQMFAGNFTALPLGATDGWDKIASYGLINGQYRFLIDTDNDGVPNINASSAANPNGTPVAGNFNGFAADGDEVAVFTGTQWSFDTDHNFNVGNFVLNTTLRGTPIVGDFDGDGNEDLGTYQNDTWTFDLSSVGATLNANLPGLDGATDISFNWGLVGSRERPVAADMNMDGFDDIGLWQPDRTGVTPTEGAEWYWLVSGVVANNDGGGFIGPQIVGGAFDRVVFDAAAGRNVVRYTPTPFGNDLYMQFGDEFALPIVGNFDPPPINPVTQTNGNDPYDVDGNHTVDAQDVLYTIVAYNRVNRGVSYADATNGLYPDVDHDGMITPQDILYTMHAYMSASQAGNGESDAEGESAAQAVDDIFGDDDLADDLYYGSF